MARNQRSTVALYGNVQMQRARCPKCGGMGLVLTGGYSACCDVEVDQAPEEFERISCPRNSRRTPNQSTRDRVIREQRNRCLYCDREFGGLDIVDGKAEIVHLEWDHYVPFAWSQNNGADNFVAACERCNRLKGSTLFQTVADVRQFVAEHS